MAGELHADSKPFSQYGLIQGVQNYSSNPFWSPNAPYNMRMPVPVYVNGPGVKTDECQALVADLISVTCAQMNNCRGTKLSDIRPSVMLQLSQMPGKHNYATACMGYIDWAYNEYMKSNSINKNATFPTYAVPNPMVATSATTKTETKPQWQSDMESRAAELASYHDQTSDPAAISNSEFPKTYADVSFKSRIDNEKLGYEPFKDAKAYNTIRLESAAEAQKRREEALKKKAKEECDSMFNDDQLASDNVSASFCRQCNTHDPYKGYCEAKTNLKKDHSCMSWCEKYRSEDTQFCDRCDQTQNLGTWCTANDSDHNDPNCESYWLTTQHWETYCNSQGTDKQYWPDKCKDKYCDTKERNMEQGGVCHTIQYCNICTSNALCTKARAANTTYAADNDFYVQYCVPCAISFDVDYNIDSLNPGNARVEHLFDYSRCKEIYDRDYNN